MITFNDILTLGGARPSEVKILRHGQIGDPQAYDTWRNDRRMFEGFQSRQGRREIPQTGLIASFVVSRNDKTVFTGMYRISGSAMAPLGGVDPMRGAPSTPGLTRIYDLRPLPEWAAYEGRLVIGWPTGPAGRIR